MTKRELRELKIGSLVVRIAGLSAGIIGKIVQVDTMYATVSTGDRFAKWLCQNMEPISKIISDKED